MSRKKIIVGDRYGRLVILEKDKPNKWGNPQSKCQCDCGTVRTIANGHLLGGHTKSCGCLHKEACGNRVGIRNVENAMKRPQGEAGLIMLRRNYRQHAKQKKIPYTLTLEQFKTLTSSPCWYCGVTPQYTQRPGRNKRIETVEHGTYTYNGIDRIDSSGGYTLQNARPCCGTCNRMKMAMTEDVFRNFIKTIYDYWASKEKIGPHER